MEDWLNGHRVLVVLSFWLALPLIVIPLGYLWVRLQRKREDRRFPECLGTEFWADYTWEEQEAAYQELEDQ